MVAISLATVFAFLIGMLMGMAIASLHLGGIGTIIAVTLAVCGVMGFFDSLMRRKI